MRKWFKTQLALGFKKGQVESYLFVKRKNIERVIPMLVHVDDYIIIYNENHWKDYISKKIWDFWSITEEIIGYYLGLKI